MWMEPSGGIPLRRTRCTHVGVLGPSRTQQTTIGPVPTSRQYFDQGRRISLIASALNRGDLAMAAIATVQMRFPDPPPLTKRAESPHEINRRAAESSAADCSNSGIPQSIHAPAPRQIPLVRPVGDAPDGPPIVPVAMPGKPWTSRSSWRVVEAAGSRAERSSFRSKRIAKGSVALAIVA